MEDMARLALVEQNVRDVEKFSKILYELLRHINYILEYPYDYELRTIKSDVLKKVLQYEAFVDYLKSIGFQSAGKGNEYTYPKENTLNKLRMAQAAIERKIYFCCGSLNHNEVRVRSGHNLPQAKKPKLTPAQVLNTTNPLLQKIEVLFNDMIRYEDEELQEVARQHVPIVTLQLMALDRVREHQRKIKTGEIKGHDLPFDMALLMELLGWFKYKFFSWVDKPPCDVCGGPTTHARNTVTRTGSETCRVEIYKCTRCAGTAQFVRYNDARTLLRTRRGRCGEWANCFTLLCRALGYETRYVYDITDHVWCEVFDYDSNSWLHVDPCEGKLNSPLIYSHGWNKKLSYVIAISRDDLQDVTWRYTMDHKEVLKRRTECSEQELIDAIMRLREHRQLQVSAARRRHLATRCLQELAQLMVERKPSDYESHGRISGSKEWKSERGEIGTQKGHVFKFNEPGTHSIKYYPSSNKYRVESNFEEREIESWEGGVFECKNLFRKVETDWQMVYLAREEGKSKGSIAWKLATDGDYMFSSISIKLSSAVYEDAEIDWTITFDDQDPMPIKLGDGATQITRAFSRCVLRGLLRGGRGEVAWQHAQLFREQLQTDACAMHILAVVAV